MSLSMDGGHAPQKDSKLEPFAGPEVLQDDPLHQEDLPLLVADPHVVHVEHPLLGHLRQDLPGGLLDGQRGDG